MLLVCVCIFSIVSYLFQCNLKTLKLMILHINKPRIEFMICNDISKLLPKNKHKKNISFQLCLDIENGDMFLKIGDTIVGNKKFRLPCFTWYKFMLKWKGKGNVQFVSEECVFHKYVSKPFFFGFVSLFPLIYQKKKSNKSWNRCC